LAAIGKTFFLFPNQEILWDDFFFSSVAIETLRLFEEIKLKNGGKREREKKEGTKRRTKSEPDRGGP
jgi:hypothetical protein